MSPILFLLLSAAIVVIAALALLRVIAWGLDKQCRQDFDATCACPLRFIRTQDGDGHVFKQYHAALCPNRASFPRNDRGGYAEPGKVVMFLADDTFGEGPPDTNGGQS